MGLSCLWRVYARTVPCARQILWEFETATDQEVNAKEVELSGRFARLIPLSAPAPHQPRPTRDAAHAMERGGVVRRQSRIQAGARAAERDSAGGVVQLTLG